MPENYQQESTGSMTYPAKGTLNRFLFKIPLVLWRMGLGPYLSHPARGGSKMLVLTTWGRVSKAPRHTMLSYIRLGDKDYVSSGWGKRSDWIKNIEANPRVTVQVGHKIYPAQGRRVETLDEFETITQAMFESGGDTHFEAWLESYGIEFNPDDMVAKRNRLILVAFDPSREPDPPPMPADLRWMCQFLLRGRCLAC